MYNKQVIDRLIKLIQTNNGINDKNRLADIVQKEFSLKKDRTVYYGDDFAIRFSKSEKRQVGNTVLSLSALQKYDHVPFIVCIVASTTNYMLLANTTF
jgi:3-deoxy-D-manno-octulosonate 8-phosphate phosphatase KdsC-like HAD superfamily phosphatase